MDRTDMIGRFFGYLQDTFEKIAETQKEQLEAASSMMADCIRDEAEGRRLHIWGTGGHAAMIAEDALYRKGGFASVNPIVDPGLSLSHGALKTINGLFRVYGYSKAILDYRRVKSGDVLIIGMGIGVNVTTIEAALEAKARNVKVIAVTSRDLSNSVDINHPARHKSKSNLYEIADIVIDCFTPPGDAAMEIEGFAQKVAPAGNIFSLAIYECLVALTAEKLVKMGIKPKIWTNALAVGGVEANKAYMDQYYGICKNL